MKDPGEALFGGYFSKFFVDVFGATCELVGEQAGFDGPDAAQPPAGDGHGLDQIHLDRAGGVELLDVGVEEELELFVRFSGKQDGLGGKAVAKGCCGTTWLGLPGWRGRGTAKTEVVTPGSPEMRKHLKDEDSEIARIEKAVGLKNRDAAQEVVDVLFHKTEGLIETRHVGNDHSGSA